MKKAIIVDDESLCIDLITSLIERYNIPIDVVWEQGLDTIGL